MAIRSYKRKKGKSMIQARKHLYEGIQYKSGLEMKMAKVLTGLNIPFQYEPTKFTLMEGFHFDVDSFERQSNGKGEYKNRGNKKVLPITYTPDFIGRGWIIETKGFAGDVFPLKWKLFKDWIEKNDSGVTLYKPQCQKECELTGELILKLYNND